MTKKERAAAVTELLKEVYPEAVCALHYTHDYELLFATRLSAQCTDARVNIVTEKLFKQFPTLQSFADASEEEIAEAIKTCGLFRTKARDLKACAMMLIANYGGRVPDTMEELLKLPGVGEKDPVKVENALRKLLDPAESSDFCHRLVLFGREHCTARSPKCEGCPLGAVCPSYPIAK